MKQHTKQKNIAKHMGNIINIPLPHPAIDSLETDACVEALQKYLHNLSMDDISNCLDRDLEEPFYSILLETGKAMIKIHSKDNYYAIEAYFKFALSLLSSINSLDLMDYMSKQINVDYLSRVIDFISWEEAVSYLYEVSLLLFNCRRSTLKHQPNYVVDRIQKYITQHLEDDLSLSKLAEKVYLNPSYLSRLYRQNTGVKLSEYIVNTWIAKAKALLETGNTKVYDVARAVGYDTAGSFIRFFRKSTGYSPREYRVQSSCSSF